MNISEVIMPTKIKVPFVDLPRRYRQHKSEILARIETVLDSGGYILGDTVESFEKKAAEYLGCNYVLGVADGTDALMLALKAVGVSEGDEVIVPVNSFIASAGAIVSVGATPIFCDIKEDLNMDVDQVATLITYKTKAIMPVHLTGRPVDMQMLYQVAKQHDIPIVEDAAQSFGASLRGVKTGVLGDVGCFSLHPLKNLHVYGDGGIISTNDPEVYEFIKHHRNHGLINRDICNSWGLNSRLDAIHATVAEFGLQHIDAWNERHRAIARQYRESLESYVKVPYEFEGCHAVYHNFVIQTECRDELQRCLEKHGIETKIHYPILLHNQPSAKYLGYHEGDFPVAESIVKTMLSLPIYPEMEDQEVVTVIQSIHDFYKERK